MGNLHHVNVRTTTRIRKEIQDSHETIAALAWRLSLKHKTILYWRHAGRVTDCYSNYYKGRCNTSRTRSCSDFGLPVSMVKIIQDKM